MASVSFDSEAGRLASDRPMFDSGMWTEADRARDGEADRHTRCSAALRRLADYQSAVCSPNSICTLLAAPGCRNVAAHTAHPLANTVRPDTCALVVRAHTHSTAKSESARICSLYSKVSVCLNSLNSELACSNNPATYFPLQSVRSKYIRLLDRLDIRAVY